MQQSLSLEEGGNLLPMVHTLGYTLLTEKSAWFHTMGYIKYNQ